ncbi:MAG: pentapeptide repeat-containing protein [Magnetospirillum sp.]|nr:MAG: pentapeptide repeat-containing protein [Magnetospirillum sp.]
MDGRGFVGHDLSQSRLRETSFQRSDLSGANLSKVDGYRVRFISAVLRGARLDDGVFSEADFTKADLSGASLVRTDLRRARFFHASLRGADLTGAKTLGADLLSADLSGAKWTDGHRICAEGSLGQCN